MKRPLTPSLAVLALLLVGTAARAADEPEAPMLKLKLYGFAMTDFGYNFGASDPDWFDTLRPTKLPSFTDEFGKDGNFFFGVRQSRFGADGELVTPLGKLKTLFEFELFGVGVDAGQTTFRLRHFYGELGHFGAGQTWSAFMDPDVFPNSIEYWGPNAMVFFRNVQARWMPLQGDNMLTITLERPGASAAIDPHDDLISLQDVRGRYPLPDLAAQLRIKREWGHVQLAGIARYIHWDDLKADDGIDLSGNAFGWGFNLSTNLKFLGENVLKVQAVYGRGIQSYLNDASDDIGTVNTPEDTLTPVHGEPIGVFGILAFADLKWSDLLTSTIGYSLVLIDNTPGMPATSLRRGHYALVNVLFHPVPEFMIGPELQWAARDNFGDGYHYDAFRVQISAKYSFSKTFE